MKKIKCLIIDDEELARSLLVNFSDRIENLEVCGTAKNPIEGASILTNQEVDLIFLDVQMPGQTGIEFLKEAQLTQKIILTTAYPDFAIEGYQLNVVDYLLKPFSFERFEKAIKKVQLILDTPVIDTKEEKDFMVIKSDHKIIRLPYKSILYIQSMREYAAFHTLDTKFLSLISLKKLESELPQNQFIRIHKSYIVSIDKVKLMEGNKLVIRETGLPIGNSYREKVMEIIFHQ